MNPQLVHEERGGHSGRLAYLPGLDGLRALAVIAVLIYHAQPGWLPGGFLGVEIFFVLSGYLITALLLAEWGRHGRINLGAFWLRRARRLLPALYLVLAATLALAAAFAPSELARLRGDTIAAVAYFTNWSLVFGHQSYFVTMGRPSLLQHLWSLAVEEQFYLVWPLLFFAGMRWCRRIMLPAIVLGAAASATAMALLYRPEADPSRLYYGTDTRATALLIGAALAFLWTPERARRLTDRVGGLPFDAFGVAALAGLVAFCLRLSEYQPLLYRGGFAAVSLTTALVIAAVSSPSTHLGRQLLGNGALRWVGVRSYGIYLWHWPVFMLTRPGVDVPLHGTSLLAVRLVATTVLAALSYRYVEAPVRTGALGRLWRQRRGPDGTIWEQVHLRWVAALGMLIGSSAVLGLDVVLARPPAPPAYLAVAAIHDTAAATLPPAPAVTAVAASVTGVSELVSSVQTAAASPNVVRPPTARPRTSVTAVGDSVLLGAGEALRQAVPDVAIDAEVGRAPAATIATLRTMAASGQLGDIVVIHTGDNGPLSESEFEEMVQAVGESRRLIFVNLSLPRPWEGPNNQVLANGVRRHPDVVLIDWHAASSGHAEFFRDDQVHLLPPGALLFVKLIAVRVYIAELAPLLTGA